jgi:hypothetical protein
VADVPSKPTQTWDLWFPEAGATGLSFARGRVDPVEVMWVHAAPATVAVTVLDDKSRVVATGENLKRAGEQLPMTRLAIRGGTVVREDRWPTEADLGQLVILPGGEVGRLIEWWNADDGSEWRWRVEFYNHR